MKRSAKSGYVPVSAVSPAILTTQIELQRQQQRRIDLQSFRRRLVRMTPADYSIVVLIDKIPCGVSERNLIGGDMRPTTLRIVCCLLCMAVAVPVLALQRAADPLTGTWTGDWGPSPRDRNTV